MASKNQFVGLARGPIDHEGSSVLNAVTVGTITMGSVVVVVTAPATELLPRMGESISQGTFQAYGIAVGGDVDGIYGDGTAAVDDSTRATNASGQGVVIVTRGRCLARVRGTSTGGTVNTAIVLGDKLTQSNTAGILEKAATGDSVLCLALQTVVSEDLDMIAVDVDNQGIL